MVKVAPEFIERLFMTYGVFEVVKVLSIEIIFAFTLQESAKKVINIKATTVKYLTYSLQLFSHY